MRLGLNDGAKLWISFKLLSKQTRNSRKLTSLSITSHSPYVATKTESNGAKIDGLLTLLGLRLIKINDVSANFNNPRPSLILNN